MKDHYHHSQIPQSRIATFDVYSVGLQKHHISALSLQWWIMKYKYARS